MPAVDCLRPSLRDLRAYDAVAAQSADKLDANEHPNDLPEWFKKKLSLLWEKGIPSNRYPDAGHHSLKQAIADYAGVDPLQVSLGNGSDEIIRSLLVATCLEGRGAMLVAEPTFSMYAITAQTLGIPVVRVPRDDLTMAMDLAACRQALTTHPIRLVCVASPNSPSGNGLSRSEWDWIRSIPESILVLIDEAYFEFSGESAVPELSEHPHWVVTRTFSKAFRLAAHRAGYALANPKIIQVLEALRLPYNLPTFSQWAVQLALEHADELLQTIPQIVAERERLRQGLIALPGVQVWPSAANFLYLRVPRRDPALLQREWLAAGTCVRHVGGGLRLTVGTPAENDRALARLKRILAPQPLLR